MSVMLDDKALTIVTTKNKRHVMIDTQYVPFPLGRNSYETMVFRCKRNGAPRIPYEALDEAIADTKEQADINHTDMINKWMKEVLK